MEVAANAAKNFIDMCEDGSLPHQLLTGSDEENAKGKPIKEYLSRLGTVN